MLRNSSLRSKTPLKRKTRIRPKRSRPRRSGRVRDRAYLAKVRELPCCLAWCTTACWGRIQADHAGARPVGRKADDDTAIPLCQKHHRDRTDYTGIFWGCNADEMRRWCDERIAETRAALGWREAA